MSLVLRGRGEHVKYQSVCSRHVGNCNIEATAIHQRDNECDAAREPIELRDQQGGLVLLGQSIAAASSGRSLRLPLSTSTNSTICSPGWPTR